MLRLLVGSFVLVLGAIAITPLFSDEANLLLQTAVAEANCRAGQTDACRMAADKLGETSEQTGIRLHTYNCQSNGDGQSCWTNSQTYQRIGHMDTALKFMGEACKNGEPNACFETVGLSIELGGGRGPASVDGSGTGEEDGKVYFQGVQAAVLGCQQGDARACIMRAQLIDEKADPAGYTAALHRGCYELNSSKACVEFSESLERQGEKEQARRAAKQACQSGGECDI